MSQSFLQLFNQFKVIHCMCPKCNSLMRVSDLRLYSKTKAEKTWLDTFDDKERRMTRKEEKFEEEKNALKEMSIKKGRRQVPKIINKSLVESFLKLNYDPYDIKSILDPIDFVVFDGMNKGKVDNVTLLSGMNTIPRMQRIHKSIAEAIRTRSYDWKTLRVAEDGTVTYE